MPRQSTIANKHVACEACGSSDAKCEYTDGHAYCFSCQTYFPPEGVDLSKYTYEYIPYRGVNADVMRKYGIQAKIDEEGKPIELGYVYPNGNPKIRHLETKGFHLLKGKPIHGLFGEDKFGAGSADCIIVTEGEHDAPSIHQATGKPAVSVQSSSSAYRDCRNSRDYLNSFGRIFLAFDNDAAGRAATASVQKLFDPIKVFHVKFSNRKDANDYLQAGEEKALREIFFNSKRYLPDTIVSSFSDFKEILQKPPKVGVPYPFKKLTEMTYGIRTGETVLFIAQEKVGKTELVHAILHNILKGTDDNVGAIFTEEPPIRLLHAIAGLEDKVPYHLPDRATDPAKVLSTIQSVVGRDDRLHVHTNFGSDDPDVFLDTVRFLVSGCGCRYIMFDHLTMVVSGNRDESDERRALDYLSTRLEMMVKELDFALIMVSHVNDNGQTRGSRYPTKVADITVSAHRDMQATCPIERSTIELRVVYNRFAGSTGPAGRVIFDRDTYSFKEMEDGGYSTGEGLPYIKDEVSLQPRQTLDVGDILRNVS